MNTVIVDSRKVWMIREDEQIACMTRCRLYKHCNSRIGSNCKKLGGNEIPKLRERERK